MKFTKPIALLLPLGILAAPRLAAAEFSAVVDGVHDGDTLTVLNGEQSIRIRLSGIDSPEMNQPFDDNARSFTAELALGTTVTVIEERSPSRLRHGNGASSHFTRGGLPGIPDDRAGPEEADDAAPPVFKL